MLCDSRVASALGRRGMRLAGSRDQELCQSSMCWHWTQPQVAKHCHPRLAALCLDLVQLRQPARSLPRQRCLPRSTGAPLAPVPMLFCAQIPEVLQSVSSWQPIASPTYKQGRKRNGPLQPRCAGPGHWRLVCQTLGCCPSGPGSPDV